MKLPNILAIYEETVDAILEDPNIGRDCGLYYEKKTPPTSNIIEDGTTTTILLDTIRLRIYNKPNLWIPVGGIQFIDGRCQIYGYAKDIPKIMKCTYIFAENLKFSLSSTPMRHGFGSKYFVAYMDLYEDNRN